ncbi:MAG: glycine cleavage system aminomethyltransferase GcvT [Candidatus Omnitrophica bacterium]|nr:glycine cleavage system aminomethyltransferase GcvT [Candidatus Omnitrophota bacterium]
MTEHVDGQALRTPLFEQHVALGGKMVTFAGWEMPIQYPEGILKEHDANRRGCSIFDCSHMGEFMIEGDALALGLDRIVTQKLDDQPIGTCRYGMALNGQGGTMDDLIVYRLADKKWMVVVNASNIDKDAAQFRAELKSGVSFRDVSFETAKIDVQGPLSRDVLKPLVKGIEKLEYYTFATFDVLGERVIVSRTGYTGELGYEIYFPWKKAGRLWDAVLADKRVKPTGLGVRDVLRIEVCYPLYGHELSEAISPLQAGFKKFVDLSKDFIGKAAIEKEMSDGPGRKLVCVVAEGRRAPRQGHGLFSLDGQNIGEIVSGTFSPALGRGIGMGFLKKEFTNTGKDIIFGDEKMRGAAVIVPRPFYKDGTLKA